ncbi:MAG TPA: T9SS type A sorting domain-containing protein [bacterium]|nr:T9SS type A sorting domain-containing protein [bacterium]
MRKILTMLVVVLVPVVAVDRIPYSIPPDWTSEDGASTHWIVLGDFNGDGWVTQTGETSTGDGHCKVFNLDHIPARDIAEVRVNGRVLGLDEYCEDPHDGWIALGAAPADGATVEVDYTWSDRLDLYAANNITATYDYDVVYYNEGDGLSEAPGWTSGLDEGSYSCVAGDLDLDGDLDLVCGGDQLHVYYNDGNGLETTPSWSHMYDPSAVYDGLTLGDYNDDGYPDLAMTDQHVHNVAIYTNEGGVLTDEPLLFRHEMGVSTDWGDYDADGDLDLAVASYGSYVRVYENVNGVIQTTPIWKNDPPPGRCQVALWGDVNDDGILDLFKGICGADDWLDFYSDVYYGDGSGLPTSPSWESELYGHVCSCSIRDATLDGHTDMFLSDLGTIHMYLWNGGGLETYPELLWLPDYYAVCSDLGDLNNDGSPDLAVGLTSNPWDYGKPNFVFYNQLGVGLEDADIFADVRDEGVLVGWEITGDVPAGLHVLRSTGESEPEAVSGALPGSAVRWLDRDTEAGLSYVYWLEVTDSDGTVSRFGPTEAVTFPGPAYRLTLEEAYPNPARGAVSFAYSLPADGHVELAVYDLAGRRVATVMNAETTAGRHEASWNCVEIPSGVYLYRLETSAGSLTRRLVVSR